MGAEAEPVRHDTLICEWCGQEIDDAEQQCPALESGRCAP